MVEIKLKDIKAEEFHYRLLDVFEKLSDWRVDEVHDIFYKDENQIWIRMKYDKFNPYIIRYGIYMDEGKRKMNVNEYATLHATFAFHLLQKMDELIETVKLSSNFVKDVDNIG